MTTWPDWLKGWQNGLDVLGYPGVFTCDETSFLSAQTKLWCSGGVLVL